jgi:hypothetical protein
MIFLATQLPRLQSGLLTQSLTGPQWLAAIGLSLALGVVVEVGKLLRRRTTPEVEKYDVANAVTPARAHQEVA